MKVLIDMNLSTGWVQLLLAHGHEAKHWSAVGDPDSGDNELLRWAGSNGSVILTNDLDFGIALVTQGLIGPSIIQLRSDDLRPVFLGEAVLRSIKQYAKELERGVLITIDPARARIRLLQLGEDME